MELAGLIVPREEKTPLASRFQAYEAAGFDSEAYNYPARVSHLALVLNNLSFG